jgi:hypothetical protein
LFYVEVSYPGWNEATDEHVCALGAEYGGDVQAMDVTYMPVPPGDEPHAQRVAPTRAQSDRQLESSAHTEAAKRVDARRRWAQTSQAVTSATAAPPAQQSQPATPRP